jgi:molybdopterin converting factor small subunit
MVASDRVRVLAFAAARDVLGAEELSLDASSATSAGAVLDVLCARYPALSPHRRSVGLAVNGTWARPDTAVAPGDEVALLPPVAGG